jgi:hypothetical protein
MLKLFHYKYLINEREADNLFHPSNSMSSYEGKTRLKTNKGKSIGRKSKKYRKYNGQKKKNKRTNNNL